MQVAVGIITTAREKQTLHKTLGSLARAGWKWPLLSADGPAYDLPFNWHGEWIINHDGIGCYKNWRVMARWMLQSWETPIKCGSLTHFMLCEDDIELSRNLRSFLERTELPEGVISLYTGAANHHEECGWHQVDVPKKSHGALATLWTPELLRDFLYFDRDSEFKHGTDHRIGMFCKLEKVPLWCHSPSFVRHTGETSAIDPMWDEAQQEFRQCKEFLEDASKLRTCHCD